MQGRQEYQPQLFFTVNIEQMIPKNHLLRKLDNLLDLSFVRPLTASLYCQDNGRPSIDPEVFFRMQLIAYFYAIDSDRRLCEEVEFNLAYRWYCRFSMNDSVPDHSSITKIRDRLGEKIFEEVFNRILKLCRKKGLLKDEISLMTDGSLVKADASLKSLVKRDENGNPVTKREEAWHTKGQSYSNKTHVSHSDQDASLTNKTGVHKALYYKVHESADRESRVIVDAHVTTGSVHDTTVFQERIKAIEERGVEISEVVADRGYGSADNLMFLDGKQIDHAIPLWRPQIGKTEEGFIYDKKKDVYRCPEGKKLKRSGSDKIQAYYRISQLICEKCPRFDQCVPPEKYKSRRGKRITRNVHQTLFEKIVEKEKTSLFKQKLWERMWKMEGLFAESKTFHTLNRARYRSRWKVQTQAYMIAAVQNLKRLIQAGHGERARFCEKVSNLLRNLELSFLFFEFSFC